MKKKNRRSDGGDAQKPKPDDLEKHKKEQNPKEVFEYWTKQRMDEAKPLSIEQEIDKGDKKTEKD